MKLVTITHEGDRPNPDRLDQSRIGCYPVPPIEAPCSGWAKEPSSEALPAARVLQTERVRLQKSRTGPVEASHLAVWRQAPRAASPNTAGQPLACRAMSTSLPDPTPRISRDSSVVIARSSRVISSTSPYRMLRPVAHEGLVREVIRSRTEVLCRIRSIASSASVEPLSFW